MVNIDKRTGNKRKIITQTVL